MKRKSKKAKKALPKKSGKKKTIKKAIKKATKKVVKKVAKKIIRKPVKQEEVKGFDFSKAVPAGDRFKGKQIVLAPQDKIDEFSHYIAILLEAIGHPEALVTDESTIYDFGLETEDIERAIEELEMSFTADDYLIDIAEKMHEKDIEVDDTKDAKKDDVPAEHEYKDDDNGSKDKDDDHDEE